MGAIREPAVSGRFYPGSAGELEATVAALLDEAPAIRAPAPKALIVPHAGYAYSGRIAARAYVALKPHRKQYRRVILVGPSHRVVVQGVALSGASAFRTPVGDLPVDGAATALLARHGLRVSKGAHAREHSLEVHLPFLQALLREFMIVPLVVGDAAPEAVAEVLDLLWGGLETLIVISSDLSHYLSDEDALVRDAATANAIERFEVCRIGYDDACGAAPIRGLLVAATQREMSIERIDLRNSGETAGGSDRVVGYGAWILREP